MRLTEFWARLEVAVGPRLARSWAQTQVHPALGNRTVVEALDAGEDPRDVWAVVHRTLELPDSER
ncbi:DUF3046 domain-containing protein [Nocardioides sp. CPCC 205120]|uniref:DUF3046 domain-containing protein n=1 Tax=Nocardioides sp. CPCC 205120 TaxID=3406462 RepID=UPI003B506784